MGGRSFAAKFWPKQMVDMVDVNERGLQLARENAELNHVDNVHIYSSDIYSKIDEDKKFGLIITNPPIRAGKKVVSQFLANAKNFLVNNGVLLTVIQKK
jgi:16S rRNA (guanine1207-N2)-methyltransferase